MFRTTVYAGPDLIRYQSGDAADACDIGMIQLNVVRVAFTNLIHGTSGALNLPRLDPRLWQVTILRAGSTQPLAAAWDVEQSENAFEISVQTNTLPLNMELGV